MPLMDEIDTKVFIMSLISFRFFFSSFIPCDGRLTCAIGKIYNSLVSF